MWDLGYQAVEKVPSPCSLVFFRDRMERSHMCQGWAQRHTHLWGKQMLVPTCCFITPPSLIPLVNVTAAYLWLWLDQEMPFGGDS